MTNAITRVCLHARWVTQGPIGRLNHRTSQWPFVPRFSLRSAWQARVSTESSVTQSFTVTIPDLHALCPKYWLSTPKSGWMRASSFGISARNYVLAAAVSLRFTS